MLLSAMMLLQAYMFVFNSEQISALFDSLGIHNGLIIPLGIAKLLAVIAILSKKSTLLKNLAYIGLAIDFMAAIISHLIAGDGDLIAAVVALILLSVSFIYDKKLFLMA